MVDQTSQMFITGPAVIKTVTGEDVSLEELGGGRTHNTKSGNALWPPTRRTPSSTSATLLTYLPQNNLEEPPVYDEAEADLTITDHDRELDALIPDSPNQPYDIRAVITNVLDDDEFCEVQELFAGKHRVRLRTHRGPRRRHRRQPAARVCGLLDIDASRRPPGSSARATASTSPS